MWKILGGFDRQLVRLVISRATIKSKLVRASYLFYKIRNVVSVDALTMLYFSLVHCPLKYCIVSWGTATNSALQPLEVVHNNILWTGADPASKFRGTISVIIGSKVSLRVH